MYKVEQHNIIVDPTITDSEYWQLNGLDLPSGHGVTLNKNDILEYNLDHYLLNNIDLSILENKAIVIKVHNISKGIQLEIIGGTGKFKRIKKEKDCYIFFIHKDPGVFLKVRIKNTILAPVFISKVDGNIGLYPFNFEETTYWEKNKYGKVHIKDTAANALLVDGGSEIEGDSRFGRDLTIERDLIVNGHISMLGPATELLTETVKSKDNNIDLNVGGTALTAHNAGITVLNSEYTTDPALIWDNINFLWKFRGNLEIQTLMNTALDTKANKSGDTFTGTITIPVGTAADHAVNKSQLDLKANLANPVFTGTVTVPVGTEAGHAVNKSQLDTKINALTSADTDLENKKINGDHSDLTKHIRTIHYNDVSKELYVYTKDSLSPHIFKETGAVTNFDSLGNQHPQKLNVVYRHDGTYGWLDWTIGYPSGPIISMRF